MHQNAKDIIRGLLVEYKASEILTEMAAQIEEKGRNSQRYGDQFTCEAVSKTLREAVKTLTE
jgi:hypothetical protein